MPRDKDLKRIVRARMQKTGEAYTAARANVVGRSKDESTADEAAPTSSEMKPTSPETRDIDYAAIAGRSDDTIHAKTGRDWSGWVDALDALDAATLEHGAIARLVQDRFGVGSWWAQTVTVGDERIRGLRETGQRRSGTYEISRSKTFSVAVERLFDACADDATRSGWLAHAVSGGEAGKAAGPEPVVSSATRPRTLRLRWPDGSRVAFYFTSKAPAKCALTVQHEKLPDRATADRLKAFWGERLGALADLLKQQD